MMIVPAYGSILGLLFVGLSWRTLTLRRKHKVGVGDGNNKELLKAIRAHANCADIGRFVHAYGVSQVAERFKFRVFGTAMTLTTMSITSCLILLGSSWF